VSALIKAAKLWSKTSGKTGKNYLTGRWGGCRVLVFENDQEGDGEPTHWLMLGDAEEGRQGEPRGQERPAQAPARPAERREGWDGSRYPTLLGPSRRPATPR
jgi:hypothetical protein